MGLQKIMRIPLRRSRKNTLLIPCGAGLAVNHHMLEQMRHCRVIHNVGEQRAFMVAARMQSQARMIFQNPLHQRRIGIGMPFALNAHLDLYTIGTNADRFHA